MPFLGNDLIDLSALNQHPRAGQDRFRRKILAEEEYGPLLSAGDPATDIWILWALKESAYKCYFQRTGRRFFAPKKFICRWRADAPGEPDWHAEIHTPAGVCYGRVRRTFRYIHALSADKPQQLAAARFQFFYLPGLQAREQSLQLRNRALPWLANCLRLPAEELIWENSRGYPRLHSREKVLSTALSLSHHGDWGAVAAIP